MDTDTANDPRRQLLELLGPIPNAIAELRPQDCHTDAAIAGLEAGLERQFPWTGEHAQAIGEAFARGVKEGWLCNKGEPASRFSRVAKPTPETSGLSVDVVSMIGKAVDHTHPKGEVTIGFPSEEGTNCTFEGRAPGWIFLGPGSRHVPTVEGGRMNLLYFLPDGVVEWHFD